MSTNTLANWPNVLSIIGLVEAESMQIGVPTLLAIAKNILGLQYSCARPYTLTHT